MPSRGFDKFNKKIRKLLAILYLSTYNNNKDCIGQSVPEGGQTSNTYYF